MMRRRVRVGEQVCRRAISPNAQRRTNKRRSNASARTSIGGHGHSIRIVNEISGGTISWSWHPLFAPRKANLLRDRPSFGL